MTRQVDGRQRDGAARQPSPQHAQTAPVPVGAATLGNLRNNIIESLLALAASTFVGQFANVGSLLILAAILAPAEYGAIGVATLVTTAFVVARNAFVFQTLIHRSSRIRESADQVIIISVVLGLALAVAALIWADAVGEFFHAPASGPILRLSGIAFLIDSIGAVPDTLFEKELRFRRKVGLELAKPVTTAVVSVGLALLGAGPISVGWGLLAGSTLWTVGLYILSDYRPQLRFDGPLMRELMNYGRYVLSGSALTFFFTNLDNASVGHWLGGRALGYYTFAFLVGYFPSKVVTEGIVSAVALPIFSKVQRDQSLQAQALGTTFRYVGYYAAPICVATLALAPAALHVVYGNKWEPTYAALQMLALYGLAQSYFLIIRNFCNGTGRAVFFWRISLLQLILVLPLLIYAPLHYGVFGTATLFTASKLITTICTVAYALYVSRLPLTRFLRLFAAPLLASAPAGLSAMALLAIIPAGKASHALGVAIATMLFILVYIMLLLILDRTLMMEIVGFAQRRGVKIAKGEQARALQPIP
ncbi:MAG TPA: oligosaccharide flippase family protein [Ktedonobacterales bacterium]